MVNIKTSPHTFLGLSQKNQRLRSKAGGIRFNVLQSQLKSNSGRRRVVETVFKKSKEHHLLLLNRSHQMQKHLRIK